jgi:hypothetical protein
MPIAKNRARDWSAFSDQQLVSHAQKLIGERVITGRKELAKADSGLYEVLRERKLIDEIGLDDKRGDIKPQGFYAKMSDEELIGFARKIIQENGVVGRGDLAKADRGLYKALQNRKLIDRVGLADKRGDDRKPSGFYSRMSDEELVGFAKRFIEASGITGRKELKKADSGLHKALRTRKLIDAVFVPIEQKKQDEMIEQLAEAVDAYTKI